MEDYEKAINILTSHKSSFNICARLCKLSIAQCKMRWPLSGFHDDEDLNDIYPRLNEIIADGENAHWMPSIHIDSIESLDNIVVICSSDKNYVTLNWNIDQLDKFVTYIEENNIPLF